MARPEHRPRKRFGQNFLEDVQVLRSIAHCIAPREGDHLVEIGPGLGALTAELAGNSGPPTLVELDRDLVPRLQQQFAGRPQLVIIQQDALKLDFSGLQPRPLRVVGNLPYNISTPLIFHLLEQSQCIADMHFMLQKEVVDRLTAPQGSSHRGRLSVMVQYHCHTEKLMEVPPEAFNPAPKVDSAVVRLVPRACPWQADKPENLEKVVALAFSQRRKTLRNTLKNLFNSDQLEAAGVDPGDRAEQLGLQQFVELANRLGK